MNDTQADDTKEPVNVAEMLRSVSENMARAARPLFSESQNQISKAINNMFARIDSGRIAALLAKSFESLRNAIPSNLRTLRDIRAVAKLTRDEGLPLTWVPRHTILRLLLEAPDAHARRQLLEAHSDEILEDCLTVLEECTPLLTDSTFDLGPMCLEWAKETNEAARALKAGFPGSAQSHAANVTTSIFPYMSYFIVGRPSKQNTWNRTRQRVSDEDSIFLYMNNLAIQPLGRAFRKWNSDKGQPPPDHFARNATAHGVGYPNVFNEYKALIAVMLATSLTRQLCHEAARYLSKTDMAA